MNLRSIFPELDDPEFQRKYSIKHQSIRTLESFKQSPLFFVRIFAVCRKARYLFVIYFLISLLEFQHHTVGSGNQDTLVASLITMFILLIIANGLCYVEARNHYSTKEKILKPGWYVAKRFLRFMGTIIASTFIVLFGFVLFVIPGVYLTLRLSTAPAACLIEDASVRESLQYSFAATKGQLTFIYVIFSILLILVAPLASFLIVSTGITQALFAVAFITIVAPVLHITLAMLYLNGSESGEFTQYKAIDQ